MNCVSAYNVPKRCLVEVLNNSVIDAWSTPSLVQRSCTPLRGPPAWPLLDSKKDAQAKAVRPCKQETVVAQHKDVGWTVSSHDNEGLLAALS